MYFPSIGRAQFFQPLVGEVNLEEIRCCWWPYRGQARSHSESSSSTTSVSDRDQLWERACSR